MLIAPARCRQRCRVNGILVPEYGEGAHWRLGWPVVTLLRAAHRPVHRDDIFRRLHANGELQAVFPAVWAGDATSPQGFPSAEFRTCAHPARRTDRSRRDSRRSSVDASRPVGQRR